VAVIQAETNDGRVHLVFDQVNHAFYQLSSVRNSHATLRPVDTDQLQALNIKSLAGVVQFDAATLSKSPGLIRSVLGQYCSSAAFPSRFQAIDDLSAAERSNYAQLSGCDEAAKLRQDLLDLVDADLQEPFNLMLQEWSTYGVSVCEVDQKAYGAFKQFYDETMAEHAIKKDDYAKIDFATQNIKPHITDSRCLDAKLTPLQIFKAAYQLGEVPAVSNLRLMFNTASKNDGKYREWMYHFDNSNYAAEFKLITTRSAGTDRANSEQCLAAFPYDTSQTIRFTRSEAATKFPSMDDLQREFSHVPGASYVVVRNPDNPTPIETGIRTEMIPHHRSASGEGERESRDSELMTFHGTGRCQPFLSGEQLALASHLNPLQRFVLGGFRGATGAEFMAALKEQKHTLNAQIRACLVSNALKPLHKITVATFAAQDTHITDKPLFTRQLDTYDNLPEVLDKIPRLDPDSADLTGTLLTIVPMLMNYDQNAALHPDCSENRGFAARTQLRERTNAQFHAALRHYLADLTFDSAPGCLLPMEELVNITGDIEKFYAAADPKRMALFASRAALAQEYSSQFPLRATYPETHQVLTLFTYYMIDDLQQAAAEMRHSGVKFDSSLLASLQQRQQPLLRHFIAYRLLSDQ
jgi:hypothetical protein